MKIDRRCFLSFGIAGAVGTALSPLPWKLTDDLSIWSQNWPWTPVPKDGETTYVNTVCSLCPAGCGISVRKVGNRAVKVEGLEGSPINDGGICMLGISGLQLLYSPTRIPAPLKRVGDRGKKQFKKISWDEAYNEISQKLSVLRDKNQPHTLATLVGDEPGINGTTGKLFERFMTAFGSPNYIKTASAMDAYEQALYLMEGVKAKVGFDFENSDFVLSLGAGVIEGWGSAVRMFQANSKLKENKGKLVQAESRLSNTAAKSDKWIPINPGSEAALALGLANVIIAQSLYKSEFVDEYSEGFETFKSKLENAFSLEKVSAATGVSKENIVALAKDLAGAGKPIVICGRGKGNTPGSLLEYTSVLALNALLGNLNKQGGLFAVPGLEYINWSEPEMDKIASISMQIGRIDKAGSDEFPFSVSLMNKVPAYILSGKGYSLEALFVYGANPFYTLSDTKKVNEALAKIPFIVSFSTFMDETAAMADIILPTHHYLERYQDIPMGTGIVKRGIGLSKPVVEPQLNTKNMGDIIIELAKLFEGPIADAFAWDDYESCLSETLDDKWDALQEEVFFVDEEYQPAEWESAFETASQKFEFANEAVSLPDEFSSAIEGENSYKLILVPYDTMRLSAGNIGSPPFMIKSVSDTVLLKNDVFVEVNPDTAKSLNLGEGDKALLKTPRGEAHVRVHLYDGIMPGVIAMPRGLGHTAYDMYLADKGVNVNELIGPVDDPQSGLDAFWGIRANLSVA